MATRKKKNNIGAFGHPIYGKGFAKYGEMRPNGSSEIPNDLEEAAEEYEKRHTYQRYDGGGLTPEYDATLAEAFIAGYNLCKEQMLKEAVEAEITKDNRSNNVIRVGLLNNGFEIGDKVRVIIVKEDSHE